MKKYNQAPLPFQGQKRRFLRQFKEALKPLENRGKLIFVDLFGGSGLLSHTVKEVFPDATVIWNDYDNYQERLSNVENTNRLLSGIRLLLDNCEDDKKVPEQVKRQILQLVQNENGYVDYITLSGSLLFSGKYATEFAELEKHTFYKTIKKTDYNVTGYLEGVKRVSDDYKVVYKEFSGRPEVIYLIDPPYLSTDCSSYSSDKYWRLSNYLDVLTTLESSNYFYFTSNKSQVIELCDWIGNHSDYLNPFEDCVYCSVEGTVNYHSSYKDIMVYKFK